MSGRRRHHGGRLEGCQYLEERQGRENGTGDSELTQDLVGVWRVDEVVHNVDLRELAAYDRSDVFVVKFI